MKITPQILSDMISNLTQLDVTCSYDEGEDMYLLRVFMVPSAQRKSLKRVIYGQLDSFSQDSHIDLFYSVQLYTEQETAEYYPEKLPAQLSIPKDMASIMKHPSSPIDRMSNQQKAIYRLAKIEKA